MILLKKNKDNLWKQREDNRTNRKGDLVGERIQWERRETDGQWETTQTKYV